ncbi:MAG: glycosyltransferase family 2 protein [Phycisphaerae bacterium]|nr:glycosyltransferase family 2 protein [Phycisphaerae bacterium]
MSLTSPDAQQRQVRSSLRPDHGDGAAARVFCDLSVIVPLYNEEENVQAMLGELVPVLEATGLDYEVICVDDGSRDRTVELLLAAAEGNSRVILVELRRNFGQTAAMAAGIEHSRGRVLVPIDGDMQNDPGDIPALLAKLEGPPAYDIVSGWRHKRHDKWLTRKLPSRMANAIIRRFTNVPIHDFGCTLKAYRREVLEHVSLGSDLHRFLPALAQWHGANIAEMVVNHRPRTRGKTKYGLDRTVRVLLDLVTVKFLGSYMTRPLYFFGKIGMAAFGLALVLLIVAIGQKFGYMGQPDGLNLNRNVLVSLSALLVFCTVQCVLFGVVSELLVRIYHDIREMPIYRVRRVIRGGARLEASASASRVASETREPAGVKP